MSVFEFLAGTLDGVFAVDRRQRVAFWNDAAQRILGFPADSVIGRSCYEVLGGMDEDHCPVCKKGCSTFRASVRQQLTPTRNVQVQTNRGGMKWISVSTLVLPPRWRELSLLVHIFRDTTRTEATEFRLEQVLHEMSGGPQPADLPRRMERLTPRELQVLALLACGNSTDSICAKLGIKATTTRSHVQRVLQKLGVHNRLEAVACAIR